LDFLSRSKIEDKLNISIKNYVMKICLKYKKIFYDITRNVIKSISIYLKKCNYVIIIILKKKRDNFVTSIKKSITSNMLLPFPDYEEG